MTIKVEKACRYLEIRVSLVHDFELEYTYLIYS